MSTKKDHHMHRWDIITIGNLSRNRYWGEGDEHACRPPLCTSTLLTGAQYRLLVDPPCAEEARMVAELDRRAGCRLADISAIFLTHEHADHHFGLRHFPHALWYAAPETAALINSTGNYDKPVEPVTGVLCGEIAILPTPGHTNGHHSLRFDCGGQTVIVAGDAVMTRDFWQQRQGYFNSADPRQVRETMAHLADIARIIIPGHDNYFLI
jgi:glyoxylase-like metal-dependent hydrolase (beta-lactamase superfamily II)